MPKNINSLVDAAVDALVASTGTWDSPTVGERIVQKLGSIEPAINPFLDANGKIALSKSAIEKLTYRLASFREIDTNWDPMTNLVDYRKDPEKVGIKIADKKFRPEIADILLEQLIFNSYHQATRVGVNYDQRALVNLMKTLAGRIAFLMTDHQDDLADALSEEGSLFNLVKEMESLPDVSIYRINMPAKYSMPRLYLHQVRLIERRCYEGFKACGKTQRPE
ncbi:MAG: hypothetical protein NTV34_12495 [Proteobacteria bacterium]|nr:hypothetical protein [Pseudomonadota bacterium]